MRLNGEFEIQAGGYHGYIDWDDDNFVVWIRDTQTKKSEYPIFTRSQHGRDINIGRARSSDSDDDIELHVELSVENKRASALLVKRPGFESLYDLKNIGE